MKIKILYEDKNILAIDKPSGILAHGDNKGKDPSISLRAGKTILDWAVGKYPKAQIAHRLDKETSGVMLIAKNEKAREFLKKQFSAPALELKTKSGLADRQDSRNKKYVAIVSGWVKNDHGVINKPIGRSPSDFRRHLAGRGARGEMREAITEYKVLKRFKAKTRKISLEGLSQADGPRVSARRARRDSDPIKETFTSLPFSYLEIKPKTGRTHQIRVHMKFLNHPVVCDSLYDPKGFCPKGIKRLALHAYSIEFKDLKGKTIKVESKLPLEFKRVVK